MPPISEPESSDSGLSRRRFIQAAGLAVGGAVAVGGGALAGADPAAADTVAASGQSRPAGFTGTMRDLKHVVIFMQENRSFDHYFATMPGVRGLNDKQALRFQDGRSVFEQRDANGTIHTPQVDDGAWGTNHNFTTLNGRRWDSWIPEKGAEAMNYHSPAYMSFYWSVASQFTICDQNFSSVLGPTDCNRKYFWSGMSNLETGNDDESNYDRPWITVPEQLQQAGIDWRLFSDNSGDGRQGYVSSWIGDYGDNELKYFKGFEPAGLSPDDPKLRPGTGLIWRGNAEYYAGTTMPNDDSEANLDAVLKDFSDACKPGAKYPLPKVSWIVAPYEWSEHPDADSLHGERYTAKVLEILQSNPDIWNHTLFIQTYDENDGKFDHVLPPYAEKGTKGEYVNGDPIGLGARVPMLLVSPWTRGGYVASEVFDHTSTIKFLETWSAYLGRPFISPNITPWRRSVVGDLTSALDFAHPHTGPATFADPVAERVVHIAPDHMKPRGISFQPHATLVEDSSAGTVTATMTLTGGPANKAISLQVFPDQYQPFSNTPFTVTARKARRYVWDTAETDGKYAFSIYGNDGFVRSFAGELTPGRPKNAGVPAVDVELIQHAEAAVEITLHNRGTRTLRYQLKANDYAGGQQALRIDPGKSQVVVWPTENGYYDFGITADASTEWRQRYAGRIATARPPR